jgi:hypothetical protein
MIPSWHQDGGWSSSSAIRLFTDPGMQISRTRHGSADTLPPSNTSDHSCLHGSRSMNDQEMHQS